ncbi:hypothetical protein [Parasulfitobacter algicola]|uniref:Uncharacterized protein n=1 Tax=Parasulfitobacter algicola TaxID=2614809 RepID=A0ABX2IK27_9RHOB|nr:hypothetical protein [Sulfitobacter algicola]NSX53237.1 hypothetical protein [Sulfitobacter algicola]
MKNLTALATITAIVLSSTSAFAGSVGGANVEGEPVVVSENQGEPQGSLGLGGLGTAGVVLAGVALLAIAAAASDDGDSSSDH